MGARSREMDSGSDSQYASGSGGSHTTGQTSSGEDAPMGVVYDDSATDASRPPSGLGSAYSTESGRLHRIAEREFSPYGARAHNSVSPREQRGSSSLSPESLDSLVDSTETEPMGSGYGAPTHTTSSGGTSSGDSSRPSPLARPSTPRTTSSVMSASSRNRAFRERGPSPLAEPGFRAARALHFPSPSPPPAPVEMPRARTPPEIFRPIAAKNPYNQAPALSATLARPQARVATASASPHRSPDGALSADIVPTPGSAFTTVSYTSPARSNPSVGESFIPSGDSLRPMPAPPASVHSVPRAPTIDSVIRSDNSRGINSVIRSQHSAQPRAASMDSVRSQRAPSAHPRAPSIDSVIRSEHSAPPRTPSMHAVRRQPAHSVHSALGLPGVDYRVRNPAYNWQSSASPREGSPQAGPSGLPDRPSTRSFLPVGGLRPAKVAQRRDAVDDFSQADTVPLSQSPRLSPYEAMFTESPRASSAMDTFRNDTPSPELRYTRHNVVPTPAPNDARTSPFSTVGSPISLKEARLRSRGLTLAQLSQINRVLMRPFQEGGERDPSQLYADVHVCVELLRQHRMKPMPHEPMRDGPKRSEIVDLITNLCLWWGQSAVKSGQPLDAHGIVKRLDDIVPVYYTCGTFLPNLANAQLFVAALYTAALMCSTQGRYYHLCEALCRRIYLHSKSPMQNVFHENMPWRQGKPPALPGRHTTSQEVAELYLELTGSAPLSVTPVPLVQDAFVMFNYMRGAGEARK